MTGQHMLLSHFYLHLFIYHLFIYVVYIFKESWFNSLEHFSSPMHCASSCRISIALFIFSICSPLRQVTPRHLCCVCIMHVVTVMAPTSAKQPWKILTLEQKHKILKQVVHCDPPLMMLWFVVRVIGHCQTTLSPHPSPSPASTELYISACIVYLQGWLHL